MPSSSSELDRGIALWKNEQRNEARQIFETLIREDNRNEAAWLWYSYTRETSQEQIAAINRFLILFPHNETARKALASLREQEKRNPGKPPGEVREKKPGRMPPARPAPVQVFQSQTKSRSSYVPWLLVALGVCLLLSSSVAFITQYNALQTRYQSLEDSHLMTLQDLAQLNTQYEALQSEKAALSEQYNSLQGRYDGLRNEYSTLQGEYNTLYSEYSTLVDQYNTLSAEHVSLTNTYNELQARYNNTMDEYSSFKETAIAPPYIYIRGREVYLAFLTPGQETYEWKVPFDQLERDLKRGNVERNRIKIDPLYPRMVLNNSGTGEKYTTLDYREFVDPQIFTSFSDYFYDRAPSERAFIEEIWFIVAQLTAYSGEISDTPRYPLETLLAGGGDCEDHAILFASMILAAAPPDWEVDLVYMDSDHPTAPQTMNHIIVYIDTGSDTYTVEATGKDTMEPYTEGVTGWYLEIEH